MSYQAITADPVQPGVPANYWYPVQNPSAPRVGWFVDDGTCHGVLAGGGAPDEVEDEQFAGDDAAYESALSDEEDAVIPKLPEGSPTHALSPTAAHPVQIGVPAKYWYPIDNPSAPRVGWFVDDGTCHGAPAAASYANVFGGRFTYDDGVSELASSDEEDVMTPELPVASPAQLVKEALPTLATLIDKTNLIAVAPAAANKTQAPVSGKDSNGRDHCWARTRPTYGDENEPEARPASRMSGTAIPSLWDRFRTSLLPANPHDYDLPQTAQRERPLDSPGNVTPNASSPSDDGCHAIDCEVAVEARPMSPFTLPPPMIQGPRVEPDRIVNSTFGDVMTSLPDRANAFIWDDDEEEEEEEEEEYEDADEYTY
ncbi:hypothetical protein AURDEDRAFT_127120 [Auricularia subglabra TFB-10046 SS5]|uniref:Uncharacterized protein n=1 Tax=Auricularia subglabra (strain TFB-10046 / SS5) TaxID=717982 RepID=J0D2S4_AURST|nr:hypothetical protein AURDEDRAFT_127120 [Auricularia subglabra TFB-10046 SS5]